MANDAGPALTRRQRLADLLSFESRTFEGLLAELKTRTNILEDDLRSLDRTLRRGGQRLRGEPARCGACGFVFRDREARRFAPPRRCPECRGEDVIPARLRIG